MAGRQDRPISPNRTRNRVELIGFMGSDPQTFSTKGGHIVTNLSIATTNDHASSEADATDWHRVVCWNKIGEYAATIPKGAHVAIVGRLQYRLYASDSKHMKAEIIASEIIQLSKFDRPDTAKNRNEGGNGADDGPAVNDDTEQAPF